MDAKRELREIVGQEKKVYFFERVFVKSVDFLVDRTFVDEFILDPTLCG